MCPFLVFPAKKLPFTRLHTKFNSHAGMCHLNWLQMLLLMLVMSHFTFTRYRLFWHPNFCAVFYSINRSMICMTRLQYNVAGSNLEIFIIQMLLA